MFQQNKLVRIRQALLKTEHNSFEYREVFNRTGSLSVMWVDSGLYVETVV